MTYCWGLGKMARGPKKHMKRISAPKHWMLDKLTGVFAPRPSSGPHKLRECIPLILLIRNRLKYALTYQEAKVIVKSRHIKVDGKVRTDLTYPCGFQDVISIDKTDEHFRLLHDTKGRFVMHRITQTEAAYKLCRVKTVSTAAKGAPVIITHDGRTIRYPDPLVKVHDTVQVDLATNKVLSAPAKFEVCTRTHPLLLPAPLGHHLWAQGMQFGRRTALYMLRGAMHCLDMLCPSLLPLAITWVECWRVLHWSGVFPSLNGVLSSCPQVSMR